MPDKCKGISIVTFGLLLMLYLTYTRSIQNEGIQLSLPRTVGNNYLNKNSGVFCVNGRILPSLFVIGIQKCGTTTLDGVLSQFSALSHGTVKEHHFFDKNNLKLEKYLKQFPICDTKYPVRTYDSTPNYTNPDSKSAENIKLLYNQLGIPLSQLIFVAIVCPSFRRVPSAYYHSRRPHLMDGFINNVLNFNTTLEFNKWFDWILEHQDQDKYCILRRGFYDDIFSNYLELFPDSTFLFIDSDSAFQEMQNLGDFLATELNLPNQPIPDIHRNVGKGEKEALTEFNLARLHSFYWKHETNFFEIIKRTQNVKTFPPDKFHFWNIKNSYELN